MKAQITDAMSETSLADICQLLGGSEASIPVLIGFGNAQSQSQEQEVVGVTAASILVAEPYDRELKVRYTSSPRYADYPADDRNRRILVVAGRSGEGPFTNLNCRS